MKCPQCQVDNKDTAKSCRKCGMNLQLPPLWQPTWLWHRKTLLTIYAILIVVFFVVRALLKPYVRQLPADITPWLHPDPVKRAMPFTEKAILRRALDVLRLEAETVAAQKQALNGDFVKAVHRVAECSGRVVVIGVGKSGLIGRKITATLASTGTPSMFVHPSEGLHGDLGMITPGDVVLALSFSGETEELKRLLPSIKAMKVPLIAMTGRTHSRLAAAADLIIAVRVKREACPYNLTPTTSTTAMLALGDALAMAVMATRGFRPEDFARLHPGGMLGKRLLWTVGDLMRRGKENPVVRINQSVREGLQTMTRTRAGATSVVDRSGRLVGYFTDGDFRRLAPQDPRILLRSMSQVMTRHPHVLETATRVGDAAALIRRYHCDNMPVVNGQGRPIGLLDERDLLSEGLL